MEHSDRLEPVLGFLDKLAAQGLWENLAFLPEHMPSAEVDAFCLPVRVGAEPIRPSLNDWRSDESYGLYQRGLLMEPEFLVETLYARNHREPLANVLDREKGHVLLVGEAGQGKTTAVWLHVGERCRRLRTALWAGALGLEDPRVRVPLVFALGKIDPNSDRAEGLESLYITDRACEETLRVAYGTPEGAPPEVARWVREKVTMDEFELCLDGLDELDPVYRSALRNDLGRLVDVPVLLTTRPVGSTSPPLVRPRRYWVAPLNRKLVVKYVSRRLQPISGGHALARSLIRQLYVERPHTGAGRLLANPLLLALACDSYAANQDLSILATRAQLLALSLDRLLERGDRKRGQGRRVRRDRAKITLLRELAWRFYRRNPQSIDELGALKVLEAGMGQFPATERPVDAEALLREFVQDGILVCVRRGHYRFLVRSLHEFCLAGWVGCESPPAREKSAEQFAVMVRGRAASWGRERDWGNIKPLNGGWEDVWPLMPTQMGDRDEWLAAALLEEHWDREDVYYSRLKLACRLAAEAVPGGRGQALIRDTLIGLLNDPATPPEVVGICIDSLWDLGDQRARQALDNKSKDAEWLKQRGARLRMLMQMKHRPSEPDSLEKHLNTLTNPAASTEERKLAAAVVSGFEDDRAVNALLALLKAPDTPAELRAYCRQGLFRTGDPRTQDAFIALLQDPHVDLEDRSCCASCLAAIADNRSQEALLTTLEAPDTPDDLRTCCSGMLARLGDTKAREVLAQKLFDPSQSLLIRCACARELANLGDARALKPLFEFLDSPELSESLRAACAEALAELEGAEVTHGLAQRLTNPALPEDVRWRLAVVLGRRDGREAREALLMTFQEGKDCLLSRYCLESLEAHFSDETREAMFRALGDQSIENSLRTGCAELLIGNGVPAHTILERIIQGMGSVGDENANPDRFKKIADKWEYIQDSTGCRLLPNGELDEA